MFAGGNPPGTLGPCRHSPCSVLPALMTRFVRCAALWMLLGSVACIAPRPPAPPPTPVVPEPPAPPPFAYDTVWVGSEGASLRTDAAPPIVLRPFVRLEVAGADSARLRVRCTVCTRPAEGWVNRDAVVFEPIDPAVAASGDLAEFVLAVRQAAGRRDLDALRSAMAPGFTHSFGRASGRLEAIAGWERERFAALDRLPALLDRGLVPRAGQLWVAPPEYVERPDYVGWRAGFRREGERWVWMFLVRGD